MNKVTQMCTYALLAALTIAAKELLAFLPNVELVSFLLIIYALYLKQSGAILVSVLFCFVQILLYGFGIWSIMYFIVWPLLVCVVVLFKKYLNTYQRCALFSGIFGLIFGFLFSIPYFIISIKTGWIYFLKGIPFDLIHAVANYLIMVVLFDPISKVFETYTNRLYKK